MASEAIDSELYEELVNAASYCSDYAGRDYEDGMDTGARHMLDLLIERNMLALLTPSTLYAHVSPSKKWMMSPHDKDSVHMDGCIPLYVRTLDLMARGADLENWGR